MTAYQSLFTELLPDKRKAAKGAAVEKGSGKDWNEKKNSRAWKCRTKWRCANRPAGKENARLNQPVKKREFVMKGAKIEDFILAGVDKRQYPMTRC